VQIDLQVRDGDVADVYVHVGTDKIYWPRLKAGESRTVGSTAELPAELTVLYTFEGESRSSCGPHITTNSRIQIIIEPTAQVSDSRDVSRFFKRQVNHSRRDGVRLCPGLALQSCDPWPTAASQVKLFLEGPHSAATACGRWSNS
jgi:hypothetical protein